MAYSPHFGFVLTVSLFAAMPGVVRAAGTCETLSERLANAPVVIANSSETRDYSRAITRQNFEIRRARSDLRKLGCSSNSIVVIGGAHSEECKDIQIAIAGMEADKTALANKRAALQRQDAEGQESRSSILASLEANGCNEMRDTLPAESISIETERREPPNFVARDPFLQTREAPGSIVEFDTDHVPPSSGGTLRTVCVRTCDGAFFPISSNAGPMQFRRDANTCAMMCSGTETELYYQALEYQESSDMVSTVTGKPYADLPTAFSYRNRPAGQKSACGCNLSAYYEEMNRRRKGEPAVPDAYPAITSIAPPKAAAPAKPLDTASGEVEERAYDPTLSKIRRIGPDFLPDAGEGKHIDLAAPLLSGPQPIQ